MSSPVLLFGSTGLTGSHILTELLASGHSVTTVSRRAPKATSPALNAIIEADTNKWTAAFTDLSPVPDIVISAIGTTRGDAGGVAQQWKIDHDLNIEIARAAKKAGVRTFVFISAAGTKGVLASMGAYPKMKKGVEDAIKELAFEHGIIIKPGAILGEREQQRVLEGVFQKLIRGLGSIRPALQDRLGQEAEVIGRATVKAAQLAAEGKAPSKYWEVESVDIIKLDKQGLAPKNGDGKLEPVQYM